jgi:hypothetical protein
VEYTGRIFSIVLRTFFKSFSQTAQGLTKGPDGSTQPKASNMRKLSWSDNLAFLAQNWANQCRFAHELGASRKIQPFLFVGQNLYIKCASWKLETANFTQAITLWFEESVYFPGKFVSPYVRTQSTTQPTGHYTSMVWANTTQVFYRTLTFIFEVLKHVGNPTSTTTQLKNVKLKTQREHDFYKWHFKLE